MSRAFDHCQADVPDEDGVSGCTGCDGSGRGDCEAVFTEAFYQRVDQAMHQGKLHDGYSQRQLANGLEAERRQCDVQDVINRRT